MQKIDHDKQKLYDAIDALESEALVFGRRFINDSRVRTRYKIDIGKFAKNIFHEIDDGKITAKEGAERASMMRNYIMEQGRKSTSDVGLAIAKSYKAEGFTMPDLENKYAFKKYREEFSTLNNTKKRNVWTKIVRSSMKTNDKYDKLNKISGHVGRGLIILTAGIAIYKVVKAKNKVKEATDQAVMLASADAGSDIGGTVGAFFGPFDIVTVPLGVFVGGWLGGMLGSKVVN